MVRLPDLVNAIATVLGNIPELIAVLASVDPIKAYIDWNPTRNEVDKAIYQIQPGQLLVVWMETRMQRGEMSKWLHVVEICVRPLPDQSILDLMDTVMAGVPVPGDGMVWRNCPVMAGLYPTEITALMRRTDTEGLDYGVILTETAETGDWPNP